MIMFQLVFFWKITLRQNIIDVADLELLRMKRWRRFQLIFIDRTYSFVSLRFNRLFYVQLPIAQVKWTFIELVFTTVPFYKIVSKPGSTLRLYVIFLLIYCFLAVFASITPKSHLHIFQFFNPLRILYTFEFLLRTHNKNMNRFLFVKFLFHDHFG